MNAILFLGTVCIIFGLLCLINSVAANALFSLFVASNYVAWGTPILCRVIWNDKFRRGEFYTGDALSRNIAGVAVVWLCFGLTLSMFPTVKNPKRTFLTFITQCNWTWLIGSGRNELYDCDQRVRLAGEHDLLCGLRAQSLLGAADYPDAGFGIRK